MNKTCTKLICIILAFLFLLGACAKSEAPIPPSAAPVTHMAERIDFIDAVLKYYLEEVDAGDFNIDSLYIEWLEKSDEEKEQMHRAIFNAKGYFDSNFDDWHRNAIPHWEGIVTDTFDEETLHSMAQEAGMPYDEYTEKVVDPCKQALAYYDVGFQYYVGEVLQPKRRRQYKKSIEKGDTASAVEQYLTLLKEYDAFLLNGCEVPEK